MRPLLQANGIDQTILVQALSDVGETMEFLETAATSDFVAGVVGWIDLTSPSVADTLATLSSDLLVGVRHTIFIEPDPEWLMRDDVQRGIAADQSTADISACARAQDREAPGSEIQSQDPCWQPGQSNSQERVLARRT
jgi:predicted TIM-barrel fold metal-dependent hydrolase